MPNQSDPETASEETTRRSFLKQGAKGALLLPYVAPVIETILLSEAQAKDDDDDDGYGSSNSGSSNSGSPSVIGNEVPPPPGNDDDDDDGNSNSDGDDDGRKFGEPKERSTSDNKD